MRLIDADALFDFLTDQIDKETDAYSKGRNVGFKIARSALHDETITPTITPSPNEPLPLVELPDVEIDRVRKMVISAVYEAILKSGSGPGMFFVIKNEINQRFEDHKANKEILKSSLKPIFEKQKRENNLPLTLEELREMDGEPVWNDTLKQWAIVDTHERRTINVCGRWRPFSDRYYRRRPEEGET